MPQSKLAGLEKENLQKICRSVIRPYAELAVHVSKMIRTSHFSADPASKVERLMEKFRTAWLPEIFAKAITGSMVADVVTDIPANEPIREEVEMLLEGTGFVVKEFGQYHLHPKFAVHRLTISWLVAG
ncbi:MAG TPA: hypothetical protein VHC68_00345 [Candidatus Paceibacterota bacterium]|nr:hypothetical protein [Candidatus Paceibacterota bacterium]